MLREAPLTAMTPHTIISQDQLEAELTRVRRRGWAEAINEREIGIASIARLGWSGQESSPPAVTRGLPGAPAAARR